MIILAIETSCDDTSIAIFKDNVLLSMDTKSQIKIHNQTGGVVPEVAAREHANAIFEVLENSLKTVKLTLSDINYIAVTSHPGLMPSLLTGITVAETLGLILKIPVLKLNHIMGHIFSNFLERDEKDIKFPMICMTVSGGHNDIYLMKDIFDCQKIGSTTDDSAGESYDKVSKMMGLGYPGGPIISILASQFDGKDFSNFPRVFLKKDEFDFSFSGLKSSVKRYIDNKIEENTAFFSQKTNCNKYQELQKCFLDNSPLLTNEDKIIISYDFQNAVNEVLCYKIIHASEKYNIKNISLAGGVSANDNLNLIIKTKAEVLGLNFISPVKKLYCMDNAAMIGILAYYKIKYQNF